MIPSECLQKGAYGKLYSEIESKIEYIEKAQNTLYKRMNKINAREQINKEHKSSLKQQNRELKRQSTPRCINVR